VILPLRAPPAAITMPTASGITSSTAATSDAPSLDLPAIAAALPQPAQASVRVLDLKQETDRLYGSYLTKRSCCRSAAPRRS